MSLSARFGKIEDSTRPSNPKQQNNAKNGKQVISPPRGPQGGARKQQRNDKQQKKNGQAQKQGKPVKQGQKGPKKTAPKPVKKTQEELDMEIDSYKLGKEAALSAKLDADMDSYHANRAAAAAPES